MKMTKMTKNNLPKQGQCHIVVKIRSRFINFLQSYNERDRNKGIIIEFLKIAWIPDQ